MKVSPIRLLISHCSLSLFCLLIFQEQVVFNRDHKLTSLIIFQPELPWKCSFYQTFHITLKASLFITLIFAILYSVNWLVKYYNHHVQKQKDEIGFMVERIIDILQSSISDNDSENFVVINHVRDMILPVKDRESKSLIPFFLCQMYFNNIFNHI